MDMASDSAVGSQSMFEVVRVQYLGKDLDNQLREMGFTIQVVPIAVSLGKSLFDLAVTKEELKRFDTSLKPASTRDNENRNSNELIRQDRFTENDLLVRYHGKGQAARVALKEFEKHLPTCQDGVKPWLEGQIKSLQALLLNQGWKKSLSPETRRKLDPEFVEFYENLDDIPNQELEGDISLLRQKPSWFAGGDRAPVRVGDIQVVTIGQGQGKIEIIVFIPEQSLQGEKRPGMEWLHAGGFAFGNPKSELSTITRICRYLGCIIFSVGYRLAPEHHFPAAVDDGTAALKWVRTEGVERYNVDINRIAVGGVSAGANLAAVTALKDAEANSVPPLIFQLLIVPLMDNAATEDNALRMANYGTPGPTIQRLLDFQRLYIATQEDGKSWQASPIRLPLKSLREWPVADACIALATADPLYHEGAKFARMLRSVGKAPVFMEVEGAPHMIMNLGGVMKKSRELLCWLIAYMADRFGVPLEGAQP